VSTGTSSVGVRCRVRVDLSLVSLLLRWALCRRGGWPANSTAADHHERHQVRTVQLLLAVAPAVFDATAPAMTGGTACAPSTPNWRRFRPGPTPLGAKLPLFQIK